MAVLQHPSNAEDIPNFSCVCISESRSFHDVIMSRLSNAVANGLAVCTHIQLLIYSLVCISVSAVLSSDRFGIWSTVVLYFIDQRLRSLCSFPLLCPLPVNPNLFQRDTGNGLPTAVVLSPQTKPPRSGPGVNIGEFQKLSETKRFQCLFLFTFKNTVTGFLKMRCALSHHRSLT